MLKRLVLGLIILIQLFLTGCSESVPVVKGGETFREKGVTFINKGSYFDVTIDYTLGLSSYELGAAYAKGILKMVPNYEFLIDSYINRNRNRNEYKNFIYRSEDIRLQLNETNKDEIEGMASEISEGHKNVQNDGLLSKDELYVLNLFTDISLGVQCSFTSVFGKRSTTKSTISGRNLDWYGGDLNELAQIQAVIRYKYKNKRICTIGFLGYMGVLTGINDSKVMGAVLVSPIGTAFDSKGKRSYAMDLRTALEKSNSIEEVAQFMKDPMKNFAGNHIIALSDPEKSIILENNFSGVGANGERVTREVRTSDSRLNKGIDWDIDNAIGSVNSFLLYGNYDNHTPNKHNTRRWSSMREQLLKAGPSVTPEEMKNIISYTHGSPGTFTESGDLYNRQTIQMILYQPENLSLEVFFRPKGSRKNPKKPVFEKIEIF